MVHSSAVVSEGVTLGSGVSIGPFAVVESGVEIGDSSVIEAHVHLRTGARIGSGCHIFTGASIGAVPQDLKFGGEESIAEIGDGTVIREYVTVHRGTSATGRTRVGSNCLLMAYVHVAHDCVVGDNVILANAVQLGGHASVDNWAILGGLTGVHQFQRIGKHVMIGAGARVIKDVPPYSLAGNEPLGFSGINAIGLKRRGFEHGTIERIREAYRIIYQSGLHIGDGVRAVAELYSEDAPVEEIVRFAQESQRGIIPLSR